MPLLEKFKQLLFSIYHLSSRSKINYVFYSEKENYRYYFLPLINKLITKNEEIYYLSSDLNDQIASDNKRIKNFYVGKGFVRMIILSLIKCNYFFMTITDLGNNDFFKSKNIKNYVYIFHALQSTHKIYTEKAFDNYDIICCNGPYQCEEIKTREEKFNLKNKKLIKSGYLYLEFLLKNTNYNKNPEYILFAPSWNYSERNLFNEYSINILDYLLNYGFKVIFRPHQEHYKRSKQTLDKIINKYKDKNNFILDQNNNNLFALENSNFLITDYSGIVHEFLFVYKKPFIIVSDLKKIHNKNFEKIDKDTFEDKVYKDFGYFIKSNELSKLKDDIYNAKKKFEDNKINLNEFIKKNIYASEKASEKIYLDLTEKN